MQLFALLLAAGSVMVPILGGEHLLGTDRPLEAGEGPRRRVRLDAFEMDTFAVTNADFSAFVEATGHLTDAERFGWSICVCRTTI